GGQRRPRRAPRLRRVHLRRALPDVQRRARVGGPRPDRLRGQLRAAHGVAPRVGRPALAGRTAADPGGRAGRPGLRARSRARRGGPRPARPLARARRAAVTGQAGSGGPTPRRSDRCSVSGRARPQAVLSTPYAASITPIAPLPYAATRPAASTGGRPPPMIVARL